jgi:hypothetical protein
MSDLGIFATGVGVGLLIVVPVFVAYRHEMALNLRRLLGASVDAGDGRSHGPSEGAVGRSTLSGGVASFGVGAGVLTAVIGVVLGNAIAIVSGVVLVSCVLGAIALGKAIRD